jgi:hypothetical protein
MGTDKYTVAEVGLGEPSPLSEPDWIPGTHFFASYIRAHTCHPWFSVLKKFG